MEIKVGEIVFLDTNVLLSATDESRSSHKDAKMILKSASFSGCHFGISGQIIREYLVVATRPVDVNGLGLDTDSAVNNVDEIRKRTVFYGETESVATSLRSLARDHALAGKRIHDANVVATMVAHNISKLITDNGSDFSPFQEIETAGIADAARMMGTIT